jgi:alanyl-tRNA synthetase
MSLKLNEKDNLTFAFMENADFDEMRFSLNTILEEGKKAVLLVSNTNGANMYMLSSNGDEAKEIFDKMREKLTIKGGFRNNFSQGKIENTIEEIKDFLS